MTGTNGKGIEQTFEFSLEVQAWPKVPSESEGYEGYGVGEDGSYDMDEYNTGGGHLYYKDWTTPTTGVAKDDLYLDGKQEQEKENNTWDALEEEEEEEEEKEEKEEPAATARKATAALVALGASKISDEEAEVTETESQTLEVEAADSLEAEAEEALEAEAAEEAEQGGQRRSRRHLLLDVYGQSLRHVDQLYTEAFGAASRKVPAHMPHFLDRHVIEDMQVSSISRNVTNDGTV
jgi:hypothetical protein